MSLLANSNAIEAGGYNIDRSLRFRSSASAYLNRTLGTPTSELIWTVSVWVKRGILSNDVKPIICATDGSGAPQESIWYRSGDYIQYYCDSDGTDKGNFSTNAVYRDPSAWYHYVLSRNGTTITLYLNNVVQTVTTTTAIASYGVMNTSGRIQYLGFTGPSSYWNSYFDGYMAEFNFIDGQALTPSSFGQTDAVTGVWIPKKYSGTYGNNGSYLPFSDNTSATTLAYDKSGNGNNWTSNNISTTAGATYDSMTDVPTLTSTTAANYCVLNPLDNAGTAISGGANLNAYTANCSGRLCGTQAVSSGKYYWEAAFTGNDTGQTAMFGICQDFNTAQAYVTYGYYATGAKYSFASGSSSYGASWTNNDVIGVALDMDAGTIAFYKNGVAQGTAFTGLTGGWKPAFSSDYGTSGRGIVFWANFGQRPFSYTPPTGFKALNTFNLPDPTIKKPNQYMDVSTWTGDNATPKAVVTNLAFQPDFLWLKQRSTVNYHFLQNSVTGAANYLASNATDAESSGSSGGWIQSFNSNGYTTVTGSSNSNNVNGSGITYVGWSWKESATAGFDIVTYTGTGVARTVSHSLGVAPKMIIVKQRNGADNWQSYHASLGATQRIFLNLTDAASTTAAAWNNTEPTSSVFTLGTSNAGNGNTNTYVAYLFAEIPGFSKFGSYTGNGSADGPFVYCGFRPKYILQKRTDSTGDWRIIDTVRGTYNVIGPELQANMSDAEYTGNNFDVLSNGFKLRNTGAPVNANGGTYIYAAFAENPFKYSLAR